MANRTLLPRLSPLLLALAACSGAADPTAGADAAPVRLSPGAPPSGGSQAPAPVSDAGAPTSDPVPADTDASTDAAPSPTPAPTGGDAAPAIDAAAPGSAWHPTPGTSWQWQLSGTLDTTLAVQVYDIDLFTNDASVIAGLQARGVKVVCYVDAGSWEPNRPDSASFPAAVIGSVMDGWPDEKWLDIRAAAVRDLLAKRLDVAKQKGCDGVEPDNVDGYANATGFPLTAADQLAYNRFLATEAHARGLTVALKNDLDQVQDLVADFDFALNEQCFQYSECDKLAPFVKANKAVFQVEYGAPSLASSVCPGSIAANFDTLIKNLALDAPRTACR